MLRMVIGFMFHPTSHRFPMIKKSVGKGPKAIWGKWNGIGGKVEVGEKPVDAMVREFFEETGVMTTTDQWYLFLTHVIPNRGEIYLYRCHDRRALEARTMEAEEVALWSPWNLPEDIVPNLTWIVPMALDRSVKWATTVEVVEEPQKKAA